MAMLREWLLRLRGALRRNRRITISSASCASTSSNAEEELRGQGHPPAEAARLARARLGGLPQAMEALRDPARPAVARRPADRRAHRRARPRATSRVHGDGGAGARVRHRRKRDGVHDRERGDPRAPVDEPDRIVRLGMLDASQRPARVSPRELEAWRSASTLAGIAAFRETMATVSEGGRAPEPVAGAYVSAATFDLLGERPTLGRTFLPEGRSPRRTGGGAARRCRVAQPLRRRSMDSRPPDHRR